MARSRCRDTASSQGKVAVRCNHSVGNEEILNTSPEEHSPEQSVFHNELMVERGKHVQNDEAGKDRRNIAVCHKARINLEGGRQRGT